MTPLQPDVLQAIDRQYVFASDSIWVQGMLETLWTRPLNVDPDHLARCILYLAEGSTEKVDEMFRSHFSGDPRDLIVEAMERSGRKINWGW